MVEKDPEPTAKPPEILVLLTDLLFQSKIGETAKRLGYQVQFAANDATFFKKLQAGMPQLIFVDFTFHPVDWETFFRKIHQHPQLEQSSLIAYTSHAAWQETEPFHKYCAKVLTKNELAQNLPNIMLGYLRKDTSQS